MSWQSYVDNQLVGSGKVSRAAILGLRGGVWATTNGFTISPEEQKAIIEVFNDPTVAQDRGVRVSGYKFFTLVADKAKLYGERETKGIILYKTKQTVLVAEYDAPIQNPEAASVTESLADYLTSAGY
ncbi:Profilin/allergen [Calocera cornea HHB12733]|uniref:Profilin n=1 Tax=Calocera cornea HHB12733 TaxID=1353952 RepID=A0A165EVX3_9BASI|nr:Profilin/allergen [Calocera cornea HHB12733]